VPKIARATKAVVECHKTPCSAPRIPNRHRVVISLCLTCITFSMAGRSQLKYLSTRIPDSSSDTCHALAYVSMRQHTPACVSIRQHASAYASMRQHAPAYVSRELRRNTVETHRIHTDVLVLHVAFLDLFKLLHGPHIYWHNEENSSKSC
jgi:hypothetical protein